MSISTTSSIKGIFGVIILFSHLNSYISISDNIGNKIYLLCFGLFGQLMVTMFFFYSGFGVMESFRKKSDYDKGFLKNRVLKTLIHFDLAVLLFLIFSLSIGQVYDWQNYVFCWIGWKALGNSNWFVFIILALYVITFASMKLAKLKDAGAERLFVFLVSILSLILWVAMYFIKGDIWCNTLLCYPLGMLYSVIKPKVDKLLQRKKYIYYVVTFIVAISFVLLYEFKSNTLIYSVMSCVFVLLFTLVTIKMRVSNKILQWLGKYSFSIYIVQRLPMMLLSHFGINENIAIFSIVSVVATLLVAFVYQKCTSMIDKKLFV